MAKLSVGGLILLFVGFAIFIYGMMVFQFTMSPAGLIVRGFQTEAQNMLMDTIVFGLIFGGGAMFLSGLVLLIRRATGGPKSE